MVDTDALACISKNKPKKCDIIKQSKNVRNYAFVLYVRKPELLSILKLFGEII